MQVEIRNLTKIFADKTAVDIPRLHIEHGDILGLVGNNGAGKTTLFRLLLDLLKADHGQVFMTSSIQDGSRTLVSIDPSQSEEWKNITGAYIDAGFLIDFLTPEEYIDFIAKVYDMPPVDWADMSHSPIAPYLAFANNEIFGQKKLIRNFSAGNKQKVGIISALFAKPELLILDEPFNYLDPSGQNILKNMLRDYHAQSGATILMSSHNLQHTIDISTRIVLLEGGHIIHDLPNNNGSARNILEDYFKV